jgi:hypothetical protein
MAGLVLVHPPIADCGSLAGAGSQWKASGCKEAGSLPARPWTQAEDQELQVLALMDEREEDWDYHFVSVSFVIVG